MRFICLGFVEERKWQAMSKSEQEAWIEECFAYDDVLFASGNWTGSGEALQSSRTAKTLRRKSGKLIITDGPYAETKEQLGGFGELEAEDMNGAVELISRHPGIHSGAFEIRPVDQDSIPCCKPAAAAPDTLAEGMKFVCLGYADENNRKAMPAPEREALHQEYIAYGEVLGKHGRWVGGEALQSAGIAKTVRSRRGKVLVTDGPYAETKEQLGGVAIFKFRDMEHAIQSWAQHPCLHIGDALEIRPTDEEFATLVAARQAGAHSK